MPKCAKCGVEFEGEGTLCMNCRGTRGTDIEISDASEIESGIDDAPADIKSAPEKKKEVKDFVDKK